MNTRWPAWVHTRSLDIKEYWLHVDGPDGARVEFGFPTYREAAARREAYEAHGAKAMVVIYCADGATYDVHDAVSASDMP